MQLVTVTYYSVKKVTRYILLVTFQSNILHSLVTYTLPMNVLVQCIFHSKWTFTRSIWKVILLQLQCTYYF